MRVPPQTDPLPAINKACHNCGFAVKTARTQEAGGSSCLEPSLPGSAVLTRNPKPQNSRRQNQSILNSLSLSVRQQFEPARSEKRRTTKCFLPLNGAECPFGFC